MLRLTYLCFIVVAVHSFQFIAAQSAGNDQTCASPSNMENSCKAIGQKHPDITLDFCVSSLKAACKMMHSSDKHELAAAATRLAIAHAQSTETRIYELMELETDHRAKGCFNDCIEVYNDAIDRMKDALDNISTHVSGKAVTHLRIALKAGVKCEKVFTGANIICPLAAVDQDYSKLTNITLHLLLSL